MNAAPDGAGREALLARWLELTREVLPGMAVAHRWPIRLDHCFMRVCLDAALGRPWHEAVRRPAVRHLSAEQLACAVMVAEQLCCRPELLPALNRQSLLRRGRGLARSSSIGRRRPGALPLDPVKGAALKTLY